jgi:hypothetical protein
MTSQKAELDYGWKLERVDEDILKTINDLKASVDNTQILTLKLINLYERAGFYRTEIEKGNDE